MNTVNHRAWLWGILVVAVLLRVLVVIVRWSEITVDVDAYLSIAQSLADGDGYKTLGASSPTAFRPPVYPLAIAVLQTFFGARLAVAGLNVAAGAATVYLTWKLGQHLQVGRFALVAAGLVAVDPLLLQYTAQPMTESLFTFLAMVLLVMLVPQTVPPNDDPAADQSNPSHHDPPARSPFRKSLAVGFVFGLCALCRPTIWIFAGLMSLYWLQLIVKKPTPASSTKNGRTQSLKLPWGILLGTAIVVGPWLVRNLIVFHQPIFTTTHGGYTLLLGNNPVFYREVVDQPWGAVWSGESLADWQRSLEEQLAQDVSPPLTEPKRDRWMYRRALQNIRDQPAHFAAACRLRFFRFWNVGGSAPVTESVAGAWRRLCGRLGFDEAAQSAYTVANAVGWAVAAFYSTILLAFVLATVSIFQQRRREWLPLLLLILSFTLVHLFYWSNTRMRAPVIPAIALVATSVLVRNHGTQRRTS